MNTDIEKIFASYINLGIEKYEENFKDILINIKNKEIIKLTDYQKFTSSIFLLESYKSLLLFWETGFGKTIFCVYIIVNLYKLYPKWKIYLIIKSSLNDDPWNKTINNYVDKEIRNNIKIINYDISNNYNKFLSELKNINKNTRIFFIIDECHDFIKKLIPKEDSKKRRIVLTENFLNLIFKPYNKILLMSATPIIDKNIEFLYLINLLRENHINLEEDIFDNNNELKYPNAIKKTVTGLCSYNKRSDNTIFKNEEYKNNLAGKKIFFIKVIMSKTQSNFYDLIEKKEKLLKSGGFRTERRLVSTFCYNGFNKNNLKKNKNYEELIKDVYDEFKKKIKKIKLSDKFINDFTNNELDLNEDSVLSKNLFSKKNNKTKEKIDTISSIEYKTDNDISNFKFLGMLSCKYIKCCEIIKKSIGKCLVYQPFVTFEGVNTLLYYFDIFKISYIEYTQKTKKTRMQLVDNFNNKDNIYGDKIKCCVFSSAGIEGISFTNIVDMIIMDIPWSGSILEQIIGRGIRLNSHNDLKIEERNTNIFFLISKTINNKSIDEEILNIIKKKEKEKNQLLEILKIVSLENIHKSYPYEEMFEKNEIPIINLKYKKDIDINKVNIVMNLIPIYYCFNINDENYLKGFLNKENNYVYNNFTLVGILVLDIDNVPKIKITDDKLIYIVKLI